MTIDEAIAHEREGADTVRGNIIKSNNLEGYESWHNSQCIKCAEEHEQIAEWLEDYKRLKELFAKISIKDCNNCEQEIYEKAYKDGYNKAIDDVTEQLKEICSNVKDIQCV